MKAEESLQLASPDELAVSQSAEDARFFVVVSRGVVRLFDATLSCYSLLSSCRARNVVVQDDAEAFQLALGKVAKVSVGWIASEVEWKSVEQMLSLDWTRTSAIRNMREPKYTRQSRREQVAHEACLRQLICNLRQLIHSRSGAFVLAVAQSDAVESRSHTMEK